MSSPHRMSINIIFWQQPRTHKLACDLRSSWQLLSRCSYRKASARNISPFPLNARIPILLCAQLTPISLVCHPSTPLLNQRDFISPFPLLNNDAAQADSLPLWLGRRTWNPKDYLERSDRFNNSQNLDYSRGRDAGRLNQAHDVILILDSVERVGIPNNENLVIKISS